MTIPKIRPGQKWQDRDPRRPNRFVIIDSVDPGDHRFENGFVYYRGAIKCRSRIQRFLRAFRLVTPESNRKGNE